MNYFIKVKFNKCGILHKNKPFKKKNYHIKIRIRNYLLPFSKKVSIIFLNLHFCHYIFSIFAN